MPFPPETVFGFFCNPQNLPPLMPSWQHARIDEVLFAAPPPRPAGSPARIATGAGSTVVLSFRLMPLLPVRVRWHAKIAAFVWNDHFCDEQTSGPFRYWRHCHSVRAETRHATAGTMVHDRVEYEFPGGLLGDVANALGGRLQIRATFAARHTATARLLPGFAARSALR